MKERFLVHKGDGRWDLNVLVDTQRKIVGYFSGASDDMSILIRDGLMRLIDDVLFLEDPDRPGYYHPRISAQHTHVYHSLDEDQKSCFNRLYDDFYYHRHNVFGKTRHCGSYLLSSRQPTCWSVAKIWE